jgi:diaminopimelate decarboxylase
MHYFTYRDGRLYCEEIAIEDLAKQYPTPFYLYSRRTLRENFHAIDAAFAGREHSLCYALKANTNQTILRELAALGAGADVVSGGELIHARRAGIPPEKIVFAGVGKRDEEIVLALREKILGLNVESAGELEVIDQLAAQERCIAPVSLRINPNIDIQGHPYISTGRSADKFGIELERVEGILERLSRWRHLRLVGMHAHVGSSIKALWPFEQSAGTLATLARWTQQNGAPLEYLDVGGGLGVRYEEALPLLSDTSPMPDLALDPREVAAAIFKGLGDVQTPLIFEPGRALVAAAGALITRVLFVKETRGKKFIIVDAAMNDLLRPSLYNAHHQIAPAYLKGAPLEAVDVVGPVCESGDFFARDRMLTPVQRGEVIAIMTAGAYGFSLSSNYNSRPRLMEILVDAGDAAVINPQQPLDNLWNNF